MDIVKQIKQELLKLNKEYISSSPDGYDFWNMHIKYVYKEATLLAKKYGADIEIVKLGAILHDIALVAGIGTKSDHHTNGVKIASELLKKYNYTEEKLNRVLGCILNHRSSKNTTNIEEVCVADADIIAHFYNLSSSFILGVKKHNFSKPEEFINWINADYEDLSEKTKQSFKPRYNRIMKTLFADKWKNIK